MPLKEKVPMGSEGAMVTNSPITSYTLTLRKDKALINFRSKPRIHLEFGDMVLLSLFVHSNTPLPCMIREYTFPFKNKHATLNKIVSCYGQPPPPDHSLPPPPHQLYQGNVSSSTRGATEASLPPSRVRDLGVFVPQNQHSLSFGMRPLPLLPFCI